MPITLVAKALKSRAVRKSIGKVRQVTALKSEEKPGFLGKLLDFGGSIISGIFKGLGSFISWGWSELWGAIVSASQFIYHFDWNASDESLDRQIKAAYLAVAGQAGGTFGNAVGFIVGGLLPSLAIMKFNPGLGATALANVTEEGLGELAGNLGALTTLSLQAMFRAGAVSAFKNTRRLLKAFNKGDSSAAKWLRGTFPGISKGISAWGEETSQPWSFALAVEETIDSINNDYLRNFVEEAYEEFWEGLVEAGYVIAGTVDAWDANQKAQAQRSQGKERVLEITPNREIPGEKIILAGGEQQLRAAIPSTLASYQLVEDRDVGQIIGEPVREYLRANPKILSIKIQFFSVQEPPWKAPKGKRLVRASYEIPDIDRKKIDWDIIKLAAGGRNGYLWGRFRCTANLDNNRQMAIYGASAEEAQERLRTLLFLTEAEVLTLSTTEELESGVRFKNSGQFKRPTRIYPAYFTILNQPKIQNEQAGRTSLTRTYVQRTDRIPLWTETKPDDFNERITELLRVPGANG